MFFQIMPTIGLILSNCTLLFSTPQCYMMELCFECCPCFVFIIMHFGVLVLNICVSHLCETVACRNWFRSGAVWTGLPGPRGSTLL